ncbi:MAG TPA: amidohydrolase family protein [Candidatus Binatia bacterium]
MNHSFTVIDADAHHLDGPAYKDYLPEHLRARSGPYFPSFGWDIFLNGTTGRKPANPAEYCQDLDVEKIGDAVAYPSNALAIGLVRELDLAVELAKAYNNWAYDFCKSTGNRVKYAAVIAPQVVPEAVKEVRRAVTEKGAVGVMMPTYVQSGLDLGQPGFDPIYAEAQELNVPVGFHATAQVAVGNTRFHKYLGVHMTSHPFEQMLSIVSVISNGVLDRFPKLKVGFLEAGVGFLPYWMERFDEKYLKRKSEMEPLKMLPSEYVKNHRCYFTCEGEESALPLVIEQFGDECMMYASDYPHWDTEWPHTVSQVARRKDISDKTKQKILAGNAKSFYRFA